MTTTRSATRPKLPVRLAGTVERFKGNGRKLGYPTANIASHTGLPDGIYFGFADLVTYTHQPSLIFIGAPVTLGDRERRIEAHLLDANDEDYYGCDLSLTVAVYHRPNQTFASLSDLVKAMKADESAARQWFSQQGEVRDV